MASPIGRASRQSLGSISDFSDESESPEDQSNSISDSVCDSIQSMLRIGQSVLESEDEKEDWEFRMQTSTLEARPPKIRAVKNYESPVQSKRPAKETLNKLKMASEQFFASFSKRKTQTEILPPTENPSEVAKTLAVGEALMNSIEQVANMCKNWGLDLTVQGSVYGSEINLFCVNLIADLKNVKNALEQKQVVGTLLGKPVLEINHQAIVNFANQMEVEPIWEKMLIEAIKRHNAKLVHKAYFSSSVLKAIVQGKTYMDMQIIADHLMSECTKQEGACRIIDCTTFNELQEDEHIKHFPELREAIKNAALGVMLDAIRDSQERIVFQYVVDVFKNKETARNFAELWHEEAKKWGDSGLTIQGIIDISMRLKLEMDISKIPNDINYKNMCEFVRLREFISLLSVSKEI